MGLAKPTVMTMWALKTSVLNRSQLLNKSSILEDLCCVRQWWYMCNAHQHSSCIERPLSYLSMRHYTCDSNVWAATSIVIVKYGLCPVTQGPYCTFSPPSFCFCHAWLFLYFKTILCFIFEQHQMVIFKLNPDDVLTFDVEGISDSMHLQLHCHVEVLLRIP